MSVASGTRCDVWDSRVASNGRAGNVGEWGRLRMGSASGAADETPKPLSIQEPAMLHGIRALAQRIVPHAASAS